MMQALRSEVAGARGELARSLALGARIEEEVREELRARAAEAKRFADERKVQREEHLDAMR